MRTKKLTYIDLFAGCGGLSLGLHKAGWKGIFAIEKSEDAFLTLRHNLIDNIKHFDWPTWLPEKNHEINHVLKKFKSNLNSLQGKIDLVVGGPPCQGFSTAGRRNENDQRNSLIKSYIKFIKIVKPKIIFFENVKGFTLEFKGNKEKGKKYSEYVLRTLRKAGYKVHGELVNFSDYGIPQKRTRFILVGIRNEIADSNKLTAKSFFERVSKHKEKFLSSKNLTVSVNLQEAISDLLKRNGLVDSPDSKNFQSGLYSKPKSDYQFFMRSGLDLATQPDSHRFSNHRDDIIERFQYILKTGKGKRKISKETRKKYGIKKHTIIPLVKGDQCPTITTLPDDYIHYCEPRILTVREYARIQSFPDWFEFKGKYTTGGKRRTLEVPRYTQIGNAIPPLFGELTGEVLKELF